VLIENPTMGTKLLARDDAVDLLAFFRRPRTLAAVTRRFALTDGDLVELFDRFILIREDQCEVLVEGLTEHGWKSIGRPIGVGDLAKYQRGYVVLGAPIDSTGVAGARSGPAEVREQFPSNILPERPTGTPKARLDVDMRRLYTAPKTPVLDLGNVVNRAGERTSAFALRVRHLLERLLGRGLTPVTIGGDHSITWYVLQVFLDHFPALGVLHFDAHSDLYFSALGRRLSHANPFVFALERPELKVIRQFGLRTIEYVGPQVEPVHDARLSYWSARELQRMTPSDAFAGLPTDIPYYLSFDVDCMDPQIAACTGTPIIGGLSYYQALELLDHAYQRFTIVGADFVEVGPSQMKSNPAAEIVAHYMARFFVAKEPHQRLETHFYAAAAK
jgi:arginase family enzyme